VATTLKNHSHFLLKIFFNHFIIKTEEHYDHFYTFRNYNTFRGNIKWDFKFENRWLNYKFRLWMSYLLNIYRILIHFSILILIWFGNNSLNTNLYFIFFLGLPYLLTIDIENYKECFDVWELIHLDLLYIHFLK